MSETKLPRDSVLAWATALFVVALAVHGSDHMRRGMSTLSSTVQIAGNTQTILALVTVVLVVLRHRWAPTAAIVVGFGSAIGFTMVHVMPSWFGPFSDSFVNAPASHHVIGFSWFAAIFEITADVLIGLAGLRALRTAQAVG